MRHLRSIVMTGWLLCASVAPDVPTTALAQASVDPVTLIIRTDDIGMSHSVNVAMQKLVSEIVGMPKAQGERLRKIIE